MARLMDIAFDALTSIQICNGRMAQVRGIEVDRQKSYELKLQQYNESQKVKAP